MLNLHPFSSETEVNSHVKVFLISDDYLSFKSLFHPKLSDLIIKYLESNKFKNLKENEYNIFQVFEQDLETYNVIYKLPKNEYLEAGSKLFTILKSLKQEKASLYSSGNIPQDFYLGLKLASYEFCKYKTSNKKETTLKDIYFNNPTIDKTAFDECNAICEGVFLTKNFVSEPPNILYPESYAKQIEETLKPLGIEIEILDPEALKQLGMNTLLGVAQGSVNPARVVVMRYKGTSQEEAPIAFIGKGVTFDSGGISIKPAGGMEDMKYDMAGSAVVVGLLKTLALRKAKVNAIGVVGLVENMPSGSAQRPSDIVTSMSGQTVEVLNTDAEGRLVLADLLWYTQDKYKPKFMINLATLTGAIVITLGSVYAGLFSNNDDLCNKLEDCGKKTDELLWRLPLHKKYNKMIDSSVADMQNITNDRGAGSITAAEFLQRFVNNYPWAHLDIAGVTWDKKGTSVSPKGATAFGVRLLNQLVSDHYEKQ